MVPWKQPLNPERASYTDAQRGETPTPQWHGDQSKRKPTGGKKKHFRSNRKRESGSDPVETRLGESLIRIDRTTGGSTKPRLMAGNTANITDPRSGKTRKTEITRVLSNPANADYNRRGVITRGATILTPLGEAQVTSRPGQDGVINAVLLKKK